MLLTYISFNYTELLNKIKNNFSVAFSHRNGTLLKVAWTLQTLITKAILGKKSKAKGIMLPDYKAVVIRTV